jgi:hypothetical protein
MIAGNGNRSEIPSPNLPAFRFDPMALSGASRRKQIPSIILLTPPLLYNSSMKILTKTLLFCLFCLSVSCGKKGPYGFETGMKIEVFNRGDRYEGSSWVPAKITDVGEDYIVITYKNGAIVTATKKSLDDGGMNQIRIIPK